MSGFRYQQNRKIGMRWAIVNPIEVFVGEKFCWGCLSTKFKNSRGEVEVDKDSEVV